MQVLDKIPAAQVGVFIEVGGLLQECVQFKNFGLQRFGKIAAAEKSRKLADPVIGRVVAVLRHFGGGGGNVEHFFQEVQAKFQLVQFRFLSLGV
ncbi:MAG: hypothetical protein HGA76_08355 [Candidatus Firestonebacteria bacterium]|nr:hypothetical protein [Candidatus Firestonebacteria bacterium]